MPRLTANFKEQIKTLSHKDLIQIVTKLATKEQFAYDFIKFNYTDKADAEKEFFEQAKNDIDALYYNLRIGSVEQKPLAKLLQNCIKQVNAFTKLSKNKVLEVDLLMHVLKIPFNNYANSLGTCFTVYDSKVAQILKRTINLISKKLHEDHKLDYQNDINQYLSILHQKSNHLNAVYDLPKSI